ncbi:hypothetical protein MLD38_028253 [Melastoma candidum]|uniref:Uncharacterized protein n=1 Tax=Melastoma candidum TaxID=119954 RepID=A0ACB9N0H9_9MYRT|nr:hypothetical protein MLD38_028253 [Melastoma candidum]
MSPFKLWFSKKCPIKSYISEGKPVKGEGHFEGRERCALGKCVHARVNVELLGVVRLMDSEGKKFGIGPRELTGAVDLINSFKLLPHYEYFCKRPLPLSISDTHYLRNVVGDTQIRKGEGMQLDQLIPGTSYGRDPGVRIQPFDLGVLNDVFQLKEASPIDLPPGEKGVPTIAGKARSESKDKEKRHKKHKDREKEKDREHKKHKHRHKDRSKDKERDKKKELHDSAVDPKKHSDKKRKHDGDEDINDIHKQKKSKHKSSKLDELGVTKVAG